MRCHVPHGDETPQYSKCSRKLVYHEGVFSGELILGSANVGGESGLDGEYLRINSVGGIAGK